jgi:hypothetical protein
MPKSPAYKAAKTLISKSARRQTTLLNRVLGVRPAPKKPRKKVSGLAKAAATADAAAAAERAAKAGTGVLP